MDYITIEREKIVESIAKANAFFHLNLEKDRTARKQFYRIKDNVVKGILNGDIDNIEITVSGIDVDRRNLQSLLKIKLTAGETSAKVHFPLELVPKCFWESYGLVDVETLKSVYVRDEQSYVEENTTKEMFDEAFSTLTYVNSFLFAKKVDAMTRFQLIERVRSTVGIHKMVCEGAPYTGEYEENSLIIRNRNDQTPLVAFSVEEGKRFAIENTTFDFSKMIKKINKK